MRPLVLAIMSAVVLLAAPAAMAAPTCQNRAGDTVRCGVPGAMPVGWSLSPDQSARRLAARGPDLTPTKAICLIAILGGFFTLLALMPDFKGWDAGEENDGKGR